MIKKLVGILNSKYPIPESGWRGFMVSGLIGLFVFAFLFFFKPFDFNILDYSKLEILGFGGITASVFTFFYCVLPLFNPHIYPEKQWSVPYEILLFVIILFCISTCNGLYINYLNNLDFSWGNYYWIIKKTYGLGLIPITIYVLADYSFKNNKTKHTADGLNKRTRRRDALKTSKRVTISSNLKDTSFVLDESQFLFAKSEGNYIEINTLNEPVKVYRLNLKELDHQIQSNYLLRCHRSYLVNLVRVERITGNAQGLKLYFPGGLKVPVSRKYINQVRTQLVDLVG